MRRERSPRGPSPWSLDRHGWISVLRRVWTEMDDDHLSLVAGGVTFFGFLALFPALAAFIATYGLVFDPAEVSHQVAQLEGVVPPAVLEMIDAQLQRLTNAGDRSLSWGAMLALVLALWSASKGTRGLIEALNVAYDQPERRGIVKLYLLGLALTLGTIVVAALAFALVAGVPVVLSLMGLDVDASAWLRWTRWPVLLVLVMAAVMAVYRLAPDRTAYQPHAWFSPGTLLATAGLVAASGFFSLYVTSFGDYDKIYGSVGAVAVFLLWLYLGSFVVLLGAELDATVNQQLTGAAGDADAREPATRKGEQTASKRERAARDEPIPAPVLGSTPLAPRGR